MTQCLFVENTKALGDAFACISFLMDRTKLFMELHPVIWIGVCSLPWGTHFLVCAATHYSTAQSHRQSCSLYYYICWLACPIQVVHLISHDEDAGAFWAYDKYCVGGLELGKRSQNLLWNQQCHPNGNSHHMKQKYRRKHDNCRKIQVQAVLENLWPSVSD